MRPTLIAILCAVVPFLAIHLAWLYSMHSEMVPWCLPYVDGCYTISRAARSGDSVHLFRALMLPYTALLAIYWLAAFRWLELMQGSVTRANHAMRTMGLIGAVFLVLYATFLGQEGMVYNWMRRYGIIVHFLFNALAQLVLTRQIMNLNLPATLDRVVRFKQAMGVIVLTLGVAHFATHLLDDRGLRRMWGNIIEWNITLAITAYFLASYWVFKRTGFDIDYQLKKPS
jgi:hypothetical protein